MGKTGCVQTLVCWDTNWSLRNVLLLEECALKNSDGLGVWYSQRLLAWQV